MRKLLAILLTFTLSSSCFAYVPVTYTYHHSHSGELLMSSYYESGYTTIRGKNLVDYDTISGVGILGEQLYIFIDGKYVKCSEDKTYTISTVTATYQYTDCGHYVERKDIIKDIREATAEEEHQLSMKENCPLFSVYDPVKDDYKVTVGSFMQDLVAIGIVILLGFFVVLLIVFLCYWVYLCIKG